MGISRQTSAILLTFFKSMELCETLFLDSHIGYVIAQRATGRFLVVNDAFVKMTGYSRKELLDLCYKDIVPRESVPWIREVILSKLEKEASTDVFESRIIRKTGGQVWLQSRIYRIDEELVLVKEIDITQAKITEAELTRALNINRRPLPDSVSGTEREVARLVAAGLSSKEIAAQIHISPRTVDNHRSSIRKKLGVQPTHTLRDALQSYTA